MTKFNIGKTVTSSILAVLVLFITYSSLQSMRANAWYFNALNIVQATALDSSNTSLLSAENAMTLATDLDPEHPHYWHFLAHIKMLGLSKMNISSNEQIKQVEDTYQQVEQALLKSVELRSTWAQTWVALAQVVSFQEGPSERVYGYLQEAKKMGPYEFNTHLGIIQIALMHWTNLPPTYKALYVNELKLASKHGYKFNSILNMSERMERLGIVCLSLQFGNEFSRVRQTPAYKRSCKNFNTNTMLKN
ncbi:VpsP family polysaccharide biosynthesis protein [Pseudoalteromonas sp. CF6-2]|uniref:VpsP family polysaccharide biosynthesis protein n=1 Tax=Pseudoalteromonas sp. CF6-2 TaxID=562716 RepID=UPI001F38E8BD|nr:VpsP family polysaccharide biosynthesis protein [Pseudoalteromonas sp. CF6-2]